MPLPAGSAPTSFRAGIEAARRGAYADDRELSGRVRSAARCRRAPARSRPGDFCLMRTAFRHTNGFQKFAPQREAV